MHARTLGWPHGPATCGRVCSLLHTKSKAAHDERKARISSFLGKLVGFRFKGQSKGGSGKTEDISEFAILVTAFPKQKAKNP